MAKQRRELVTHTFQGPRFDDHGLDIDVLPELVNYKLLLVETAKELWRRRHPDRERLPKNFEDSLVLRFYEVQAGSTAIPLVREMEDQPGLWQTPDELDEAVGLIADAIDAAGNDRPLPEALPKSTMPLFANYGKTLRADESILQKPFGRSAAVRYTPEIRDRIARWTQADYEDVVNLFGEVRAADVDGCNFTLRLDGATKLAGKFKPEQEQLFTDALREHESRRLRIRGRAEFSAADGKPKRILSVETVDPCLRGQEDFDPSARPIWEALAEVSAAVPDAEWQALPADLSKNTDHYIYGARREGA